MGFPEIRGAALWVPIIKDISHLGVCIGVPGILGNYHMGKILQHPCAVGHFNLWALGAFFGLSVFCPSATGSWNGLTGLAIGP